MIMEYIWFGLITIKLSTLFESVEGIGLTRKLDSTIRLWINTGSVSLEITNPALTTTSLQPMKLLL